jgi:uncharacterized repeat protein (TIGR03987 family)
MTGSSTPMIVITLALLFYSIGVWSERLAGRLKPWHLAFFWLGLICDTWGTGLMFEMAGGMAFDLHGITGMVAIMLMMVHAFWATVVLVRKDENAIINFHKFSVVVWLIWLIPYFSPMIFGPLTGKKLLVKYHGTTQLTTFSFGTRLNSDRVLVTSAAPKLKA